MGIMGLVATVAGHAARMFGRGDLGKASGLGGILFMTAAAEVGDLRQFGDVGGGIVGMLRQGSMAGFAGDMGMFAGAAGLALVLVAHQAGILAREGDGMLPHQVERPGPVMPVLPEGFGDDSAANHQKDCQGGQQNCGWPHQMSGIAEQTAHRHPPL